MEQDNFFLLEVPLYLSIVGFKNECYIVKQPFSMYILLNICIFEHFIEATLPTWSCAHFTNHGLTFEMDRYVCIEM